MTRYHLSRISSNSKTGPIPVSTTTSDTCPSSCPLKQAGCYAELGPLAIFWRRLDRGQVGVPFETFLCQVHRLPPGTIWRHSQAGDLPGIGNEIHAQSLVRLAQAARHTQGWTYSHKPLAEENLAAIYAANQLGFTVNHSANGLRGADEALVLDLPVVVLLPANFIGKRTVTPAGRRVIRCPATYLEDFQCIDCGWGRPLCARRERDYAIGFPARGSRKQLVSELAKRS